MTTESKSYSIEPLEMMRKVRDKEPLYFGVPGDQYLAHMTLWYKYYGQYWTSDADVLYPEDNLGCKLTKQGEIILAVYEAINAKDS